MRDRVDAALLRRVLDALARASDAKTDLFLVGGSTAVWEGWRPSTIDVDFVLRPENDEILRAIPALKDSLRVNIELASPADFIPVPEGWEDRSPLLERIGPLSVRHFDLDAQAIAKIERGHEQDRIDVASMIQSGLVKRPSLWEYFLRMEPNLYRFPAIDATTLKRAVRQVTLSE